MSTLHPAIITVTACALGLTFASAQAGKRPLLTLNEYQRALIQAATHQFYAELTLCVDYHGRGGKDERITAFCDGLEAHPDVRMLNILECPEDYCDSPWQKGVEP
jgi:hypothetical protein